MNTFTALVLLAVVCGTLMPAEGTVIPKFPKGKHGYNGGNGGFVGQGVNYGDGYTGSYGDSYGSGGGAAYAAAQASTFGGGGGASAAAYAAAQASTYGGGVGGGASSAAFAGATSGSYGAGYDIGQGYSDGGLSYRVGDGGSYGHGTGGKKHGPGLVTNYGPGSWFVGNNGCFCTASGGCPGGVRRLGRCNHCRGDCSKATMCCPVRRPKNHKNQYPKKW